MGQTLNRLVLLPTLLVSFRTVSRPYFLDTDTLEVSGVRSDRDRDGGEPTLRKSVDDSESPRVVGVDTLCLLLSQQNSHFRVLCLGPTSFVSIDFSRFRLNSQEESFRLSGKGLP